MFNLHQAPGRFLAAPIAGAALVAAVPAAAQDAHGVIAFGETAQGKGVAYGFSWNFDRKDAAHAEAVNACISSGGTDCVQLAWFQNGCGALAIDQYGNAQGKPGMSSEQAEARALRTCEGAGEGGCNIVGSACAAPGGEPGTWSGSESVVPAPGSQTTATAPEGEPLTREERIRVQQSLTALGFDVGPADGVFGRRTWSAIWEWQTANGLEATGQVTRDQFASIMAVDASPAEPTAAAPVAGRSTVAKSPTTVPAAEQGNCTTTKEKVDAVDAFILEHYGRTAWEGIGIFPSLEEEGLFKTYFYPEKLACGAVFTVDKDCRIGDAQGTVLANAALRKQAIHCELDNEE